MHTSDACRGLIRNSDWNKTVALVFISNSPNICCTLVLVLVMNPELVVLLLMMIG